MKRRYFDGYHPGTYKIIDEKSLADDYRAGMSEIACSRKYGITRAGVRCRIISAGIIPRSGSEANIIRMGKLSKDEKLALTKSAHDSVRGKKASKKSMEKISKTRHEQPWDHLVGRGEKEFIDELNNRKISFEWQYPIGGYNIDFLFGSVAVELRCETCDPLKREPQRKKIEYLLSRNFSVIYILFTRTDEFIGNLDKIISEINLVCGLPFATGQYRMIRCYADRFTRVRRDNGQFAVIPSPVTTYNVRIKDNLSITS